MPPLELDDQDRLTSNHLSCRQCCSFRNPPPPQCPLLPVTVSPLANSIVSSSPTYSQSQIANWSRGTPSSSPTPPSPSLSVYPLLQIVLGGHHRPFAVKIMMPLFRNVQKGKEAKIIIMIKSKTELFVLYMLLQLKISDAISFFAQVPFGLAMRRTALEKRCSDKCGH